MAGEAQLISQLAFGSENTYIHVDFLFNSVFCGLYSGPYLPCHLLSFHLLSTAMGIYSHCVLKNKQILPSRPAFQIFREGIFKHELKYN